MNTYFANTAVQRLIRFMAIVFIAMAGTLAIGTLTAPAAHAISVDSGSIPGLDTVADLVTQGGSNAGGGPGLGGGGAPGGTALPSQNPDFCAYTIFPGDSGPTWHCTAQFSSTAQWVPFNDNMKNLLKNSIGSYYSCSAKQVNGFTIAPEGAMVVTVTEVYAFGADGVPRQRSTTSVVCVYSNAVVQTQSLRCIINYTAMFDRTANSRLGYAGRVMTKTETVTSKDEIMANPDNCVSNYRARTNYNPPTNQNAWGQYNASSRINYLNCTKGTSTFEGKVTKEVKCNSTGSMPGKTSKLTIWCGGWAPAHVQKSWSASDCYATGAYSCKIPTPATYNGLSGTVQGIRDGKNSVVKWGTPQLSSGIRNSTNWKSLTNINSGSTPYNGSYSANDKNKQLFVSDNVTFGSWMSGQKLSQNLGFYTAGSTGSPFSMTRNYKYDAQFLTSYSTIASYDVLTGAIVANNNQMWVPDVNVPCGPQGSPNINVIRAIGDKVG